LGHTVDATVAKPTSSHWGEIVDTNEIAPGIIWLKTATRCGYRLSAPRRSMRSFAQSFSSTVERDDDGAPQWASKDDRMEPSRIASALDSARWA
jgi:hypothetical protein